MTIFISKNNFEKFTLVVNNQYYRYVIRFMTFCNAISSKVDFWLESIFISKNIFKGSSDPSHFISEINVGKSRIRHRTTLNINQIIFKRFRVDPEIHFQSRSMSDPSFSDIDFKNKMVSVLTTLKKFIRVVHNQYYRYVICFMTFCNAISSKVVFLWFESLSVRLLQSKSIWADWKWQSKIKVIWWNSKNWKFNWQSSSYLLN